MTSPTIPNVERGRELARLRKEAGLLLRQVGAVFDIDKSAVSSWENGLTRPASDKLGRLDKLYGGRGEVLALFGFSSLGDERLAKLEADLVELAAAVKKLGEQVAVMDAERVRGSRQARQASGESRS